MAAREYLRDFEEAFFLYTYRFTLQPLGSAGDTMMQAPMPINGDADFDWRALTIDTSNQADFKGNQPVQASNFFYKLYLPGGQGIQRIQSDNGAVGRLAGWGNPIGTQAPGSLDLGNAAYPLPIVPDILLSRSSTMAVDLRNFDGNPINQVELCLRGCKLLPRGQRWQIPRGRRYTAVPFTYYAPFPGTTANKTFFTNTVQIDNNSHFLLYSVEYDQATVGLCFQLYGPEGELTSNGLVSLMQLAGGARYPGCLCPPIAYPAGGRITFDMRVPTGLGFNYTTNFAFRGVRLYPMSGGIL